MGQLVGRTQKVSNMLLEDNFFHNSIFFPGRKKLPSKKKHKLPPYLHICTHRDLRLSPGQLRKLKAL